MWKLDTIDTSYEITKRDTLKNESPSMFIKKVDQDQYTDSVAFPNE